MYGHKRVPHTGILWTRGEIGLLGLANRGRGEYMTIDLHALAQTAREKANRIALSSPAIRNAAFAQCDFDDAVADLLQPTTPPDPPNGGTSPAQPAAPGSTGEQVTTITKKELPVNIYQGKETRTDLKIVSSSDSAVMVQPNGAGSTLVRVHAEPCCDMSWSQSYGRHGAYLKAEDVTLEDFFAKTAGGNQVKNGISARMRGLKCRRFRVEGFPLAVAFFNDGTNAGPLLFEDGSGTFTSNDSGCWIDGGACDFTFRRCEFNGPTDIFLAANSSFSGKVVIDACKVNGKPVTAERIVGLPPARLTIV